MRSRFTFERLQRRDLALLYEWLSRPHVAEWWGGPVTLATLEEDWEADRTAGTNAPALAYLDDTAVGYIQAYEVLGAGPDWWTEETDPGARGIDQFLARETDLGRGLGTRMIRAFVARLFDDPAVTKVQADPSPDNARAIRAYEKAGFRQIGAVTTPDGAALLMVVRREDWRASLRPRASVRPRK